MLGLEIFVSSISQLACPDTFGNLWQYHPRGDRHSRLACWCLLLDLLGRSELLRTHAAMGIVGFGINHVMADFSTGRKKNLDLVICRPGPSGKKKAKLGDFDSHRAELDLVLPTGGAEAIARLPNASEVPVGAVHVAVEAKACMTEHIKARPRLYDELNSSHLTVHGNSPHALAVGLTLVNLAENFISPLRNKFALSGSEEVEVTHHRQPHCTEQVIEKLHEIPRRSQDQENGFDAFSISVVECKNDGSPVKLVDSSPAPSGTDIYHYEQMVNRLAHLYEQRFAKAG